MREDYAGKRKELEAKTLQVITNSSLRSMHIFIRVCEYVLASSPGMKLPYSATFPRYNLLLVLLYHQND